MENKLMNIQVQEIRVKKGAIEFGQYDELLVEAQVLAENISNVVVTEDTVKASKKLLAEVGKKVKELEDIRILAKKQLLEPYQEFEKQVKDITGLVTTANNVVRSQVRDLEDQEREEKRLEIEKIYDKRIVRHPLVKAYFTFEQFLKPQHLNKSVSLDKVESEMVQYLSGRESDLSAIMDMDNKEEVLAEYLDTKDLGTALRIIKERDEYIKSLQDIAVTEKPRTVKTPKKVRFTIETSEKDLIMNILQQNKITFKMEEI